jgi:hypothetical protein
MIYNTNTETKAKEWSKFAKLIEDQFRHGGEKYKLGENKEATDWVCEGFPGETGADWMLGTMAKYLMRFKNFKRERDLLKMANYCFLIWIKMGFHINTTHDTDTRKDKDDL